jgi:hypothetical protein
MEQALDGVHYLRTRIFVFKDPCAYDAVWFNMTAKRNKCHSTSSKGSLLG